jgi:nitrogen fixation/metabolism regulation signal transduction histidine kinase
MVIYLILCVLTVLFSKSFFNETLREGGVPELLHIIVFFSIPAVLLVLLSLSILSLLRDLTARRAGSKFQARLLAYFIITVVLSAAPVTIITIQSIYEAVHFWRSMDMDTALEDAQAAALENYDFRLQILETLAEQVDFDPFMTGETLSIFSVDRNLRGVQDFVREPGGTWRELAFAGNPRAKLSAPPSVQPGFAARNIDRDPNLIRYGLYPRENLFRLISYSLGDDFDRIQETLSREGDHLRAIDSLRENMRILLVLYYGVFFFPTLLMTVIITVSFSRRVTQPIVELTEATRRVAEGDFSIQILTRPEDELGLLIRSFNAMVQDLETSRAALVKAEKISAWQTMAQQLAHEIKNPLTPIKLSAERVLRRWRNSPGEINGILEDSMLAILQEVEGLSHLLTEFRTFSRPIEPVLVRTSLRELIEETAGPYRNSYPAVSFKLDHLEDISLNLDRRHIAQALINLISNAVDAMGGRGEIEIRTDIVKKRETRYCRLSIRDTGKGIPKEAGPEIFTPYFTTKESGTGLGLPIVERIVGDHGGRVWFNSAEGMGSTFFIDLPMDEPGHFTGKGREGRGL